MQIQVSRSFRRQRSHLQPFCQNPPAPDTHVTIEDDQGTSFLVSFHFYGVANRLHQQLHMRKFQAYFKKWVSEYSIYNTEDSMILF